MTLFCTVMNHVPSARRHHNQGMEFSICHRCGCDMIRTDAAGDWTQVPQGFRVVWREFGRASDATDVAQRMHRLAPPARRREARNARPAPRRDPRGRPIAGATSMVAMLAKLGKLVAGDDGEKPLMEKNGQYVICLPGPSGR
ncbi:ferric-dicitrate binding protein FerR (iron transport regulator) [Sphingomonas naasensis]|uniref:Uncharacterized protein n=1 Tax=Sphingomonas naasensis TaxID=1344951 RepID=A0A4S1WM12_9SPHN|nr:hypothetical protein [Sphingomonas naasensis]NIJ20163.1 ferric-dicitrate binding protein FerR (iron transport regulator) [Sphingomonas naasensis]TGX44314.1 hypothetical protein E5A74_05795 [Sphingomonas naasensis]